MNFVYWLMMRMVLARWVTTGAGAGEAQGVQDKIDLYFSTFAKSMASIGAFIGGDRNHR